MWNSNNTQSHKDSWWCNMYTPPGKIAKLPTSHNEANHHSSPRNFMVLKMLSKTSMMKQYERTISRNKTKTQKQVSFTMNSLSTTWPFCGSCSWRLTPRIVSSPQPNHHRNSPARSSSLKNGDFLPSICHSEAICPDGSRRSGNQHWDTP